MNSNRGRKALIYSTEKINALLKLYIESEKPIGKIKYKDVFSFFKEMYENGELDIKLSEDFWRKSDRQGREAIDKLNELRNLSIKKDDTYIEILSTSNIVNEYSKDTSSIKNIIISRLKINEYGYRNLYEKYKKLSKKQLLLEEEIISLKKKLSESEEKNRVYEQVLFQWANISSKDDIKLINTITTGKTRSKIVEQLLLDMFSDEPNNAYKNINMNANKKTDNVIKLTSKKRNSLVEDLDL